MDVRDHNRRAWDLQVEYENPWTVPVGPEEIAAARAGELRVYLTPSRPVPPDWLGEVRGARILALACGGGQQVPLFAAAGAEVTVLDNSPRQLSRDREVAEREGLSIRTVEGDMRDLSVFADESFDLVFHPVSICFVPECRPVWREAHRVLRPGGALLSGVANPSRYLFDWQKLDSTGEIELRHRLPYSDAEFFSEEEQARLLEQGEPLESSHTLEDLLGGQIDAGFLLAGLFEDGDRAESADALEEYFPGYLATRAVRPGSGA